MRTMQGCVGCGVQLAGPQEEIIREKLAKLGAMASRSGLDMGRSGRSALGAHWLLWTVPTVLAGVGGGATSYYYGRTGGSLALGAAGAAAGALAAVGILAMINRGRTTKQDELVAQLEALTTNTAPGVNGIGYVYPEPLRPLNGLGLVTNEMIAPLG